MNYNSTFKYDLEIGQLSEKALNDVLSNKKVEVKRDLQAHRTGNVYVEYMSRGKWSGISTSTADYYCFFVSETQMILIQTPLLKLKVKKYINTQRDRVGGDNNTSRGILLPLEELVK